MRLNVPLCRKVASVGELTKLYSNLPEAYIKRSLERVEWKTPRGFIRYLPKTIANRPQVFTRNRPWTNEFWREHEKKRAKVFVEPIQEWTFFKGDRVELLVGPDKGKQGIICQVIQERNWVIVEGLNCILKTFGKTKTFPGTVVREEQPLLVTSEIKLVDPADLQGTDIEWRFTEDGKKVRVSSRSGRIIPVPVQAAETYDYKTKNTYKESPKDTPADEVTKVTFKPTLATFEMDIMKSQGIEESRVPAPSYWY